MSAPAHLHPLSGTVPLVVVLVALMLLAAGAGVRDRLMAQARLQAERSLTGLATIKHDEVLRWLEDIRVKNARPPDGALEQGMLRLAQQGDNREAMLARLQWQVDRSGEFRGGWLVDAAGRLQVAVDQRPLPPQVQPLLAAAREAREPLLGDFYLDERQRPALASVTPLRVGAEQELAGHIVIEVDPAATLYPLLRTGLPATGASEVLLARHEGEVVRFLTPLLGNPAPPLGLSLPVDGRPLLALREDGGTQRVLEAQDYRGVPVTGVVRPVAGTRWVLVTKMDSDAVYAEARSELVGLAWRGGVLLLLLGIPLWITVQWRQARRDMRRLSSDLERVRREKLLEFFVHYASDVVLLMDEQGRILELNEAATRAYGYSREELLGMSIVQLRAPDTLGALAGQLAAAASADGHTFKTFHQRRDGSRFPVEVSSGLFEHQGRRYRQSIIRDISAREAAALALADSEARLRAALEQQIALNRRLEEAQNQLLQSEKMASIGQLAAGVAHEINNPIGFVSSNLGSLREYTETLLRIVDHVRSQPGDGAALEALLQEADYAFIHADAPALLDESMEGIARVRKIVQDLKDFSRVGERDWQWADPLVGLDSTLNIVWNEIKYKARVEKRYAPLPEIWCLPSQLNQVFLNLLVNAAHAIEHDGLITLSAGAEGEGVWVEVADNGCGIPQEHLARIFDPFFTTKPVGKGTGLGLSLAFSIVRKHGGHIHVRSAPGQGSAFRITLPRVPPGTDPSGNPAPNPQEVSA